MSTIVVEARDKVTAFQAADFARQLPQTATENRAAGSLVVTGYLGKRARERLNAADIWYLDLTGNARIALDRPALFIDSHGANREPRPVDVVPNFFTAEPQRPREEAPVKQPKEGGHLAGLCASAFLCDSVVSGSSPSEPNVT